MKHLLFLFIGLSFGFLSYSQKRKEVFLSADSAKTVTEIIDSSDKANPVKRIRVYYPRTAAIRSAILPGLGQIYNKKYWKLPIVYGAIGVTGAVFLYNLKWYKRTRFAVKVLSYKSPLTLDTVRYMAEFPKVNKDLQFLVERGESTRLAYIRDQYRRDIDYSALFVVLFWGLNVVDATVDAHLKSFDVSPDLSFKLKLGHSEMAGTNGVSLVLAIGKTKMANRLVPDFRN